MVVLAGAALFAAAMGLDVFRQAAMGRTPLNPPSFGRAIAVAALTLGLATVLGWMTDLAPGPRASLRLWNLTGIDSYAPGWRAIAGGYVLGVVAMCSLGVVVFACMRFFNVRQRWAIAGGVAVLLSIAQSLTPLQFVLHLAAWAVGLSALVLIARTCSADFVGLGVAAFWVVGVRTAIALIRQPAAWLRGNGIAALVTLITIGIVVIAVMRAARAAG